MKTMLSLSRIALWALALGTTSIAATYADTTAPAAAPSTATNATGGNFHHQSVLTDAEKAQLKNARHAAFAADPSLKTEKQNLKQAFQTLKSQNGTADKTQWQALHAQAVAYHQKLRAAELNADPTLAPVFSKLDAAPHRHWHHSAT